MFPARVNVQFIEVISFSEIKIQIWERGAGYTLASGSSSCAAVAAAHRMGLVGEFVTVHMPGGTLQVSFAENSIQLSGPIEKVFEGNFSSDLMVNIRACDIAR
jgi:diaminopimelate epimerase